MQKSIRSILSTLSLICMYTAVTAQAPATVKQGPSGIFIFPGKEIPSGKTLSAYKIERSEDSGKWKKIAEIKTPAGFNDFTKAVDAAKLYFPSQPIPATDKLNQLYQKAVLTGTTDSLKGMRLLFPIRVALGVMFYDTSAKKNIAYQYRVNSIISSGEVSHSSVSDTISLPFQVKFDTIKYSESSYNNTSVFIKWKSFGKNPAPLFMVYKFRYGAPVVARGKVSRYEMNDTTYYIYMDSAIINEVGKDLQFFVSPFDHFGNSGQSSQVAVITKDNFNKAVFMRNHIEFMPKLSGVQVCWHFSDPYTVKTVEIYRSEKEFAGFRKLADALSTDTSYLDQQIWPEKTYYYYLQVVAKAGRRTKQSEVMMAEVPGIVMRQKLNAPLLRQVSVVKSGVRLLIEVNDSVATNLRIYRGPKGGMVALPDFLETQNAAVIAFTDSTLAPGDKKDVFYAVRNEIPGAGISSLSEEMPVEKISDPNEVEYFYAFPSKGKIALYWDDVANRKSSYASYTLARKYGPANSRSPLMVLAEGLTNSSFIDEKSQDGNQYTYELRLADKTGNSGEKSYKVTILSTR